MEKVTSTEETSTNFYVLCTFVLVTSLKLTWKGVTKMNKKIALSGLSIMAALTILAGATYAAFSDFVTATGNTFAVGNADLQIALDNSGAPGTYGDTIPGPTFSGIIPGQTKNYVFWLKNASTSATPLDLTADINAIDPTDDGAQTIDNTLLVSWTCDTDHDNSLANNTPTAEFSPRDWLNGGNAGVGALTPGQQMECELNGRLPDTADNTVAGQTVSFDARYDGNQTP